MATLADHSSSEFTKLLLMGDSGTGKTGALASLVDAGYTLWIIDLDNGLDALVQVLRQSEVKGPPLASGKSRLEQVNYVTYRDKVKATAAGIGASGSVRAFRNTMDALTKWPDSDIIPSELGSEHVVVVDSLTFLGKGAYAWAESLDPGAKDKRQHFFAAQQSLEAVLGLLTSEDFRANVCVISHVNYVERQDGTTKGFPNGIGTAMSPKIPPYFNSVVLAETKGSGDQVKRTIRTMPTALIDLKNPAGSSMPISLPLETGLGQFFRTLQGTK